MTRFTNSSGTYTRLLKQNCVPASNCFPHYSPLLTTSGESTRAPVDSPHKRPTMQGFDVFFAVNRINLLKQTRVVGHYRRRRLGAHVTVMMSPYINITVEYRACKTT